jgi:glutathione gamma-glutamylcysteinyltransferase
MFHIHKTTKSLLRRPFKKRYITQNAHRSFPMDIDSERVPIKPACLKFNDTSYIRSLEMKKLKKIESFYKRPLPSHLIEFSSEEGKLLFKSSFVEGYMESYFHLAPYYVMQSEPAFCGLATLSMALNSLHIDPDRIWKGPWRWYTEESFNCCFPLKTVRERGISIQTFYFLAQTNGSEIQTFYCSESTIEEFRKIVMEVTSNNKLRLIVSYDRAVLGQTGTGHFSPIGGYNLENDLVLIMDVAQFKYPPHWVPLSLVFKSMQVIDPFTGKSRGYFVMRKSDKSHKIPHHNMHSSGN